jgi:hypothetical protein
MRSIGLALVHNKLATGILVFAVIGFAIAQRMSGPLTIPVLDQMAVRTGRAGSGPGAGAAIPDAPAAFPVAMSAPASAPEAPSPSIGSLGDQLLGAIHISSGDVASRPADPTVADPLRVGFALGAPASVRITVAADRGPVVATLLKAPPAPAGARVVEWNGNNTDGSQATGGRYLLSVEANEDSDVYRKSVRDMYLFVARPDVAVSTGSRQ